MGKHAEINQVVSDFKSGIITHSECLEFLIKQFKPLYESKRMCLKKIRTDHRWTGNFHDFYLQVLDDSLRNFDFGHHNGVGPNKLSFVPYFQGLFHARTAKFMQIVHEEIEAQKITLYIDSLKSPEDGSDEGDPSKYDRFEYKYLTRKSDEINPFDEQDLEDFITTILSKREWKIYYLKRKGYNDTEVGLRMKVQISRNQVRLEWNDICEKIKTRILERQKECLK